MALFDNGGLVAPRLHIYKVSHHLTRFRLQDCCLQVMVLATLQHTVRLT